MFNDERIKIESGKICRKLNFLTLIFTSIYLLVRIMLYIKQKIQINDLGFGTFSTEIFTIISTVIILLYGEIKHKVEVKDERTDFLKYEFYNKSAKLLLISIVIGYAISMIGVLKRTFYDFTPNYIMFMFQIIGIAFLYINFKKKQININYSFINNNNKTYYKQVFKLIGYFALIAAIIYITCGIIACFIYQGIGYLGSFVIALIISIVGLGGEYLFLSFLEKLDYDDEKHRITKSFLITAFVYIGTLIINVLLIELVKFIGESDLFINKAQIIAEINQYKQYINFISSIYSIITLSYILSYFLQNKKIMMCIYIYYIGVIISYIKSIVYYSPLYIMGPFGSLLSISRYLVINQWLNYIFIFSNLVLVLLLVLFIVKELKLSNALIILPIIRIIIQLIYMYFNLIDKNGLSPSFSYVFDAVTFTILSIILYRCGNKSTELEYSEI